MPSSEASPCRVASQTQRADQRQAEQGRQEQAPGNVADQVIADVVVLADLYLQGVLVVPLAEVAPVARGAARLGEAVGCGQRRFRGIFRTHQQFAVGAPDLEAQAALVFVGGIAEVLDIVAFAVAGQCEQGLPGLGELGVEQFVDLVMGVDVAENHGRQPGGGDTAEQQAEQAAAQREPGGRHLGIV